MEKEGTTMGEAIDLLKLHVAAIHTGQGGRANRKKMDRPAITAEATEATWKILLSDWKRYKSTTEVRDLEDIRNELLNCCSTQVRSSLANSRGAKVEDMNEEQLVDAIKKVAVKISHVSVHRKAFHKMHQEEGENLDSCLPGKKI